MQIVILIIAIMVVIIIEKELRLTEGGERKTQAKVVVFKKMRAEREKGVLNFNLQDYYIASKLTLPRGQESALQRPFATRSFQDSKSF